MFQHHLLALVSSLFSLLGRVDHQTKLLEVQPGDWEGLYLYIIQPTLLEVQPLDEVYIYIFTSMHFGKIKVHKFKLSPLLSFCRLLCLTSYCLCLTIETLTFSLFNFSSFLPFAFLLFNYLYAYLLSPLVSYLLNASVTCSSDKFLQMLMNS